MRIAWVMLAVAACGGGGSSATPDATTADAGPDASACGATRTVFLNRGGGTYVPGADDATTNATTIFTMSRTVPPPTTTDPDWATVLACVTAKLQPYNVTVTDVDPVSTPHIEVVIIDNGNQIGFPGTVNLATATPCVGGFGTAATNTIAFAAWLGDNNNRCWDITQGIGYTLGLDNVLPCEDVMSIASTPCSIAGKAFTATDAACGDVSARACRCGGTTQNAMQRLLANVGARCL